MSQWNPSFEVEYIDEETQRKINAINAACTVLLYCSADGNGVLCNNNSDNSDVIRLDCDHVVCIFHSIECLKCKSVQNSAARRIQRALKKAMFRRILSRQPNLTKEREIHNDTECKDPECKDPNDPECKDPECKDPDDSECKDPECKDPECEDSDDDIPVHTPEEARAMRIRFLERLMNNEE